MTLTFQPSQKQWDILPPLIRQAIEKMDRSHISSDLTNYFRDMKRAPAATKRALTCVMLDMVSAELKSNQDKNYQNTLKEAFLEWFSIDANERIWIQRDSMLEKNHPGLRWINFHSCIHLLHERLKLEKIYDEWSPILEKLWDRIHLEFRHCAINHILPATDMWNAIAQSTIDVENTHTKNFHHRMQKDMLMFLGQYNDVETPEHITKLLGDEFTHMLMYSCRTLGIPDAVSVADGIYGNKIGLDSIQQIVEQHLRSQTTSSLELDSSSLDVDFDV